MAGKSHSDNKVRIIFIVGGVPVPVDANVHWTLGKAREEALKQAEETGRPAADFSIRHNGADSYNGIPLSPDTKIGDFNFVDEVELDLALDVGGGG
jgi:hypothetical protein